MRSLLQFLGVWGAWIAVTAGMVSIAIWAISLDEDASQARAASTLLLWMFWPVAWIRLWLTGKNAARVSRRSARASTSRMPSNGTPEQSTPHFKTVRDAKEYLVDVIAKEAEINGTGLSEVERKMLYFTETGWTLPNMKEISAEFDRNYDQDGYEKKIAAIIARIDARLTGEWEQERMRWDRALEKLSEGDHYLLVLVDAANRNRKGAKHNWKILIIALVFFAVAAVNAWLRNWLRDHS